jgi:hypothetical protein
MKDIIEDSILGKVIGYCYTIEFQKRGLPHCHLLLILDSTHKIRNTSDIDQIISAEFPDKYLFPLAFETVSKCMIHGPCGELNPNSPCMKNNKCTKGYPKVFIDSTQTSEDGYPKYRRRIDGQSVIVERNNSRIEVDNRFVVPHNLWLSTKYDAHINVELSESVKCVKYLYKYINKGPDKANVELSSNDEIKTYLDARYISSCESCWRIFGYDLHENRPNIYRLEVHLENQHTITFNENNSNEQIVTNPKKTKLMAWFDYNKCNSDGHNLLYIDFPKHYTFEQNKWKKRKNNLGFKTIGRMYLVNPSEGEKYYLRLMLTQIRGAKGFIDLKTVNNITYETYKETAQALGLLDNDEEWDHLLEEAQAYQMPKQFRILFSNVLFYCNPENPRYLFNKYFDDMSRDVIESLTGLRQLYEDITNESIKNMIINCVMTELDNYLINFGKSISDFTTLPQITQRVNEFSRLIGEELSENYEHSSQDITTSIDILNQNQRIIFDEIINTIEKKESKLFFIDGPGGTGKTFLYNTLLDYVRSKGMIAIALASSGLASLLLKKGRTAHSRLKIPINIHESSSCFISAQSDLAQLIRQTEIFIWDEAPFMTKYTFEAVDRTFRDLMKSIWWKNIHFWRRFSSNSSCS